MEISWQPEPQDLVDAVVAHRQHRQSSGGLLRRARAYRLRSAVLSVILLLAAADAIGSGSYALAALWAAGSAIWAKRWFEERTPARANARLSRQFTKLYHRYEQARLPASARIDSRGIFSWTSQSSAMRTWPEVYRMLETPSSFVAIVRMRRGLNIAAKVMALFRVKAALPIPKRALAGPAEIADLRELLQEGTRRSVILVSGARPAPTGPDLPVSATDSLGR